MTDEIIEEIEELPAKRTFYEALDELETISSHIDKEEALVDIIRSYTNAESFFRLAFNDTVYGIQERTLLSCYDDYTHPIGDYPHVSDWLFEIPKLEGSGKHSIKVPTFAVFCEMIRRLSGDEQKYHLRKFFDFLEPTKKKWFSRALLHDLRCGVQVKTVNKVFKRMQRPTIDKFAMQLAKKLEAYDETAVMKGVTFPCSGEIKYDGYRIQATVVTTDEGMYVELMSRRGNDRTKDYPEVVEELKFIFEGENVILDGEMVAATFQSLTRKDDTSKRKFVIFDVLNDERLAYQFRWSNLENLCSGHRIIPFNFPEDPNEEASKHIFLAEHYDLDSYEDLIKLYDYANDRKEEGIIVKLNDKPYIRGKRDCMFKCKKTDTADLKVIGWKPGDGKRRGMVATLELEDASGTIKVDVGSGIDDAMCEKLTNQLNETVQSGLPESQTPWMYEIIEIRYNGKTETGSLRFPRFVKFRDDKDTADDLSSDTEVDENEDN